MMVQGAPHRRNFRLPGSSDRTANVKSLRAMSPTKSVTEGGPATPLSFSPKKKKAAGGNLGMTAKEREAERVRANVALCCAPA